MEFTPFTPFIPFGRASRWRTLSISDCIRIVESFEFRGGLSMWRPKLAAAPTASATAVMVQFSILVPDRTSPQRPTNVAATETWALETINEEMVPFEDLVAGFVRGVVEHEMHEGLFAGGRQLLDPHAERDL